MVPGPTHRNHLHLHIHGAPPEHLHVHFHEAGGPGSLAIEGESPYRIDHIIRLPEDTASTTNVVGSPGSTGYICADGYTSGYTYTEARAKIYHSDPGDPATISPPGDAVSAAPTGNDYRFEMVPGANHSVSGETNNWILIWILRSGTHEPTLTRKRQFKGVTAYVTDCAEESTSQQSLAELAHSFPPVCRLEFLTVDCLPPVRVVQAAEVAAADELCWRGTGGDGSEQWILNLRRAPHGYGGLVVRTAPHGPLAHEPEVYHCRSYHPAEVNLFYCSATDAVLLVRPSE